MAFATAAMLPYFAGCSKPEPVNTDPVVVSSDRPALPEPPTVASEPDTVATVLPDWPVAPPGEPSPTLWEDLFQDALVEIATGEHERGRDLIFHLQELASGPAPAAADSLYREHRRSIQRRTTHLAAIVSELKAFGGDAIAADSVLATEYLMLSGLGFPDSLVPATGTELTSLQADLLRAEHARVDRWIDYFTGRGRKHFQVWLDRRAEVDSLITTILVEEGLPTELIYLAMIESGLSTRATSNVGAAGPWQFMPGTARANGLTVNWWVDERRDFERATRAACRYIKRLYAEFGDWALVLAGYNSGEGRVRRQLRSRGHDNFWDYTLPRQTVEYVPKFIAAARIGSEPEAYGFTVTEPRPLAVEPLIVSDATDLTLIAECAEVPAEQVYRLNPGLRRRATPPGVQNYIVNLPAGTVERTQAALRRIPASKRLTWRKHEVQRGETLSHIAATWGTNVRAIQEANALGRKTLIHPGDQLLIPMPRELQELARKRAAAAGQYVPPAGHERITYQVRSGDTLGAIARKLGVSVSHLERVNGIKDPRRLRIGQRLTAYRAPSNS